MSKLRYTLAAALLAGTAFFAATGAANALSLSTGGQTGTIASFGNPDSQTYGQIFTSPVNGTLNSFTLYLDGDVGGDLYGGIGIWNGSPLFSFGSGTSSITYQSGNITSTSGPSSYTFLPNIPVTAGTLYVAFLSVFGTNASTTTSMPTAQSVDPNILYFVWNNGNGGPASGNWNYFFNIAGFGSNAAQFDASITPAAVPLPGSLPLFAAGLAGLAAMARRRTRTPA